MFAHREVVRGGSAVMVALEEDFVRLAYRALIPHRGRGGSQADDGDRTAR